MNPSNWNPKCSQCFNQPDIAGVHRNQRIEWVLHEVNPTKHNCEEHQYATPLGEAQMKTPNHCMLSVQSASINFIDGLM